MRTTLSGLMLMVGGLSGSFVLVGTESSGALVVVGALVLVFGLFVAQHASEGPSPDSDEFERDQEQHAEYLRAKQALQARATEAQRQRHEAETARLLEAAPHLRPDVEAVLERAGEGLNPEQRAALALDLARRFQEQHATPR